MEIKDYTRMNNESLKEERISLEREHESIKAHIVQLYKQLDELDDAYNAIGEELTKRHIKYE